MKVSIITPSYNQGHFIERTLKSVANQTGGDIEHIVMDGGSTDNTIEILKQFSSSVKWVSEEDNGQADAVNKGIRMCDGEIIGWLNSDDMFYPGAIEKITDFFELNPDIEVVYGMADHIDKEDQAFEQYPTEEWDFERLKYTCFISQPALFFRRRVIEEQGLLDESLQYCMDYEYWLRLGKAGVRFAFLPEKLAGSRLYAENKTLGSRKKVHHEINDMLKKKFGRVPDRWLNNYAHVSIEPRLKGSQRSTRILLEFQVRTVIAALKWNRVVSNQMGRSLILQIKHSFNQWLIK